MLGSYEGGMVDRAVEAATDEVVDRVVANLRAAREPVYDPTDPIQVAAVERLRSESAAPSPGERLVASVQTSVSAYQRGRREALDGFGAVLREIAARPANGRNQRVAAALTEVAELADRAARGDQPGTYCPGCKEDAANHYPCGVLDCPCWCQDPDTPQHMRRSLRRVGS